MIQVISIGTDRRVFEEGSAVRERLLKQRELFSELHVIVFARRSLGLRAEQLGNLWLYPTNSLSRLLYVRDASALAQGLIEQRKMSPKSAVITVQDPFECGLAGMRASRKSGKIPFHVQIHTDFLSGTFQEMSILNRVRILIARRVLAYAKGIRVVSERIAQSLRKSDMRIQAPIEILPVFSPREKAFSRARSKGSVGAKKSSGLVLVVSRFAPEKDLTLALTALKRLLTMGDPLGLMLVGEGPEKEKLVREIAVQDLAKRVRIEPWQSNTQALYEQADIVLVTSRFEGYGLVLFEAAVAGRPIVTTDVGIARELIAAPYDRFICPVGDIECIVKGVHELLGNIELRQTYGTELKAIAQKLAIPEADYWKLYQAQLERCVSNPQ